jgi:ubiquinone/menaquinone biosynthesis C-methylase UbiE
MATTYSTVTELPGYGAPKEQLVRLHHRYHFASLYCKNKDVLEIACGPGMGLGYLAKVAKKVVGIDIDDDILAYVHNTCKGRENIEIRKADAQILPFGEGAFDVAILYEAIYYLPQPEKFINEARRILRDNGVLIICTVNKEWTDFNPSPFSFRYFSVSELYELLRQRFSCVELYGAFATSTGSVRSKITSMIKRTAVALHLIPRTMKGKEFLKRIFFGKLVSIPAEIEDGMAEYDEPRPIPYNCPDTQYKVLYAVAYVRGR